MQYGTRQGRRGSGGAVLAIGALLCAAPLAAQANQDGSARPIPPAAGLPGTPTGFNGYTFCRNGLAESWVRADKIGTPELDEILAHEAVHREQAAQFPTCEAWLASVSSARAIIDAEIPAYCAQLTAALRHGSDRNALVREYVFRIAAQSGAMENRLDIRQIFDVRCPVRTAP